MNRNNVATLAFMGSIQARWTVGWGDGYARVELILRQMEKIAGRIG